MLDNFLNKSKPINFVVLLAIFFSVLLYSLLTDLYKDNFSSSKILESLLIILLFVVAFFFVNFIVLKNKLTYDNSYAFFFYTTLFIYFLPETLHLKTLSSNIIYLLILRKIYSLNSSKQLFKKTFDAGFWLGIFFIFEPFSLPLLILLYASIYIHKKATINSLIIPFIGFLTPLIVYFTYLFWFDKTKNIYDLFVFDFFSKNQIESKVLYCLIPIISLSIISIFFKTAKIFSINNTFQKKWTILLINFSFCILFFIVSPSKNYENVIYLIFPTAIILANGIELIKKPLIKNIFLYLFLICSFIIYFL